jgi:hypothetical protein
MPRLEVQLKEDEMDRAYNTHGRGEKCLQPEGKRSHGRIRRRWENNIRMDLKRKIRWKYVE